MLGNNKKSLPHTNSSRSPTPKKLRRDAPSIALASSTSGTSRASAASTTSPITLIASLPFIRTARCTSNETSTSSDDEEISENSSPESSSSEASNSSSSSSSCSESSASTSVSNQPNSISATRLTASNLSKLQARLSRLLPKMRDANEELEVMKKEGRLSARDIENLEDVNGIDFTRSYLKMKLAQAGLEEQKLDSSDSNEGTWTSDEDDEIKVLRTLLGKKKCDMTSETVKIQEMGAT